MLLCSFDALAHLIGKASVGVNEPPPCITITPDHARSRQIIQT